MKTINRLQIICKQGSVKNNNETQNKQFEKKYKLGCRPRIEQQVYIIYSACNRLNQNKQNKQ